MKIRYIYPWRKIIFPNIIIIPLPLLIIPLYLQLFDISKINEDLFVNSIILCFILTISIIALSAFFMTINKINTEIEVGENGLFYKTMFKKLFIKWNEIASIEKKYLFERKYPRRGLPPDTLPIEVEIKNLLNKPIQQVNIPNDLIIKTQSNNKIKILHHLKKSDDSNKGIEEFEEMIKSYCNVNITKNGQDKLAIKEIREWRKLLTVSIFMIVIGIILSIYKTSLIPFAFILFGIWLLIFYIIEYVTRNR